MTTEHPKGKKNQQIQILNKNQGGREKREKKGESQKEIQRTQC